MPLTAEQQLIIIYRGAASTLRRQLLDDIRTGRVGSAVWRRRQLAAVRRQLAALGVRTRATTVETIAAGFDRGATIADIVAGRDPLARYAFVGAHRQSATVLATNLSRRLDQVRDVVGRRMEDAYRQAALEAVGEGVVAGQTRREVSRSIERRLLSDGLTGFVDKRGAQWQMDTYAEMVARTTTREAMTAGTRGRMIETGQDLVTISDHQTDTDICKPFEGNTYSLTGATAGYELLPDQPPFHPRCLHVMTPAAENLDRLLRDLGVAAETGSG